MKDLVKYTVPECTLYGDLFCRRFAGGDIYEKREEATDFSVHDREK
jgi:hypothetical protein